MKRALLTYFLLSTVLSPPLFSEEAEPFACRHKILKAPNDAADDINAFINKQIKDVQSDIEGDSCDREDVTDAIDDELRGSLFSWLTPVESNLKGKIKKDKRSGSNKLRYWCSVFLSDSYYKNKPNVINKGLADVVKLCGRQVSLDKLSHFFAQGFDSYKRLYPSMSDKLWDNYIADTGSDPDWDKETKYGKALLYSYHLEDGKYGSDTTGVISYADISANMSGLNFYNELFSERNSPRSLFTCEKGKLKRTTKNFDICDYVNESWDEAVNCSEFINKDGSKTSTSRCPLDESDCYKAVEGALEILGGHQNASRLSKMIGPKCLKAYNNRSANTNRKKSSSSSGKDGR